MTFANVHRAKAKSTTNVTVRRSISPQTGYKTDNYDFIHDTRKKPVHASLNGGDVRASGAPRGDWRRWGWVGVVLRRGVVWDRLVGRTVWERVGTVWDSVGTGLAGVRTGLAVAGTGLGRCGPALGQG